MRPQTETALSVIAYSFCSGTLVVLNKFILHHLPYPGLVSCFQLVAVLVFILGAKHTGLLQVDDLQWKFVPPYLYYIIAFAIGEYCYMKSLSRNSVETVIVFRALSPCFVAFLDAAFLGRELPSLQSWFGLAVIVLGAYGYASFDPQFQSQGMAAYVWPILYLLTISFEMAYGKALLKSVDLKTKSGPVLYTNFLGIFPMLMFAAMSREFTSFYKDRVQDEQPISAATVILLLMGCVAGTGIGYSSWWCRDRVSATTFTLIGVMNKCLTVLLNLIVWDQHAPPGGIAALVLCLVGGSIYRQSPMRSSTILTTRSDEEEIIAERDVDDDEALWKADTFEPPAVSSNSDHGEEETIELIHGTVKRRNQG